MFNSEKGKLTKEVEALKREVFDLELEADKAVARKEREEMELKHIIKMKEEKMEMESKKFEMKCEKEKDSEIATVKDEYRDKLEEQLKKETDNIKVMYSQILERLPNISAKLSGKL